MGLLLLVLALAGVGWAWTPDKPRAELEALYAGPASEFSRVMGVRVHLRDSAPGDTSGRPVLLMLHGFGGSLHSFEAWATGLAATHRVIRIDLPGAGLTGADPSGDYSDERGIALRAELLDQRGVARASVLGHSMGGLASLYAGSVLALTVKQVVRAAATAMTGSVSPSPGPSASPRVSMPLARSIDSSTRSRPSTPSTVACTLGAASARQ